MQLVVLFFLYKEKQYNKAKGKITLAKLMHNGIIIRTTTKTKTMVNTKEKTISSQINSIIFHHHER